MVRFAVAAVVMVLAMTSCGGGDDGCGAPEHDEYDCEPLAGAGAVGCHGDPTRSDPQEPAYPVGCTVTLPVCNRAYDTPQTCSCSSAGSGGPAWACGL